MKWGETWGRAGSHHVHTCNPRELACPWVGFTIHPAPNHLQDGRPCGLDWLAAFNVSLKRISPNKMEMGAPFDVLGYEGKFRRDNCAIGRLRGRLWRGRERWLTPSKAAARGQSGLETTAKAPPAKTMSHLGINHHAPLGKWRRRSRSGWELAGGCVFHRPP